MKKCVFCHRSPPEVKISGEHVLRAKLAKILPTEGMSTNWAQKFICPTSGELTEKQRKIPSGPFDHKVNDVCKECNEGWLNRSIEIPAEKYIEPAIVGAPILTSPEARHFIALWAAKTAAVRGLMDPLPRGVPEDHYRWIMENLTPPPHTYVWLAKCQFIPATITRHIRFYVIDHTSNTVTPCHMTMLVIGFMALYILGCTAENNTRLELRRTINKLDSEQIIRIWPQGVTSNTEFLPPLTKEHLRIISSPDVPNLIEAIIG